MNPKKQAEQLLLRSGVNPGDPRDRGAGAFLEQKQRERELLGEAEEAPAQGWAGGAPSPPRSPAPIPKRKLYPVSLQILVLPESGNAVTMSFDFMSPSVSIKPNCISVAFEEGFDFVADGILDAVLKFNGTAYPVTFLGSVFEFDELDLRGVSFARKENQ